MCFPVSLLLCWLELSLSSYLTSSLACRLYRERITQVETKLNEVRMGRAPEYLVPVDELQENCRIKIEVAGVLRQFKLQSIRNSYDAEEQAANQNFQVNLHTFKFVIVRNLVALYKTITIPLLKIY